MSKRLSKSVGKGKKPVVIPVYYRVKDGPYGNQQYQVLSIEDGKKAIAGGDKAVECLVTKWRPNAWKTNNVLLQTSMSYNPQMGSNEVDYLKFQDNMVKTCMVEWDLTDENEQPIPVTTEAIDDLPPDIVKYLIQTYDKSNTISEEEVKNSPR